MPADAMPSAIESQFHHQPGIFLRSWSFIESLDLPSACGWVRRSDWVPRHPVAELIFQRPIFFWQFTIQRRQGRGSSFLSFRFFCKKNKVGVCFFWGWDGHDILGESEWVCESLFDAMSSFGVGRSRSLNRGHESWDPLLRGNQTIQIYGSFWRSRKIPKITNNALLGLGLVI